MYRKFFLSPFIRLLYFAVFLFLCLYICKYWVHRTGSLGKKCFFLLFYNVHWVLRLTALWNTSFWKINRHFENKRACCQRMSASVSPLVGLSPVRYWVTIRWTAFQTCLKPLCGRQHPHFKQPWNNSLKLWLSRELWLWKQKTHS